MGAHRSLAEQSTYGSVHHQGRDYPLVRLQVEGSPRLVITAGFHGEEPAGPLTLAEYLPEIVLHARKRGVGLTIYPCVNPSGFELGTRYNRDVEKPNNDLLRYELAPGVWTGELERGQTFLSWKVHQGGPQETQALRAELETLPTPIGSLDLHQDDFLEQSCTYAYVFGSAEHYAPLMEAAQAHIPVAREWEVDVNHHTDAQGLIYAHDGSVTDYFLRRGALFNATLETTTQTAMAACHQVNLIWIHGFIELAAGTTQG